MNFTLPYTSPKDLSEKWLTLFQGMMPIGDRGKALLVEVLVRYLELREVILDTPTLWEVLWSVKERKGYRDRLTMSSAQFTNLLSDIRKAGILIREGDYEYLTPQLLPEKEFKVTFQQV